jgi:adenylylsulfate kinase
VSERNISWSEPSVSKLERAALKKQRPCLLWFTGLSGSGKSTISALLDRRLYNLNLHSYVLDGDNIRHGLNKDLGFSPDDRTENIRRIGEVSKLFIDSGLIVISAFISPFRADRDLIRAMIPEAEFFEVYINAPLDVCEGRDPKGLYKKARAGEIKNFTGISSPYEPPLNPEITLSTGTSTPEECVESVVKLLKERGYIY